MDKKELAQALYQLGAEELVQLLSDVMRRHQQAGDHIGFVVAGVDEQAMYAGTMCPVEAFPDMLEFLVAHTTSNPHLGQLVGNAITAVMAKNASYPLSPGMDMTDALRSILDAPNEQLTSDAPPEIN
jgi:hypothetical protein